MSRSKKDGRKRGAHHTGTRSKWHEAKARRQARTIRHRNQLLGAIEYEAEAAEIAAELWKEVWDEYDADANRWEWTENYLAWQDSGLQTSESDYDEFYLYEGYNENYQLEDNFWDDPPAEPQIDIFQAVDRAVRRHGAEAVRNQAHLLAAALGVSLWEIERAVKLTRDGYIASWR